MDAMAMQPLHYIFPDINSEKYISLTASVD
jgi:hypothetical protein